MAPQKREFTSDYNVQNFPNQRREKRCFICDKIGHIANDCTQRINVSAMTESSAYWQMKRLWTPLYIADASSQFSPATAAARNLKGKWQAN